MLITATLLALGVGEAQATSMVPLTIEQLVSASDHVIKGKVTETWTEPDPETGLVWTNAQVEIETVLKGDKDLEIVVLEQPGGKWGNKESTIEGSARFSIGEVGYFFVENLASGKLVTTGMFQGKFNILMDPYQRKEIAVRFSVPTSKTFNHNFLPLPDDETKRVTTENFESKILTSVEKGWDGKPIPGASDKKLKRINKIKLQPKVNK